MLLIGLIILFGGPVLLYDSIKYNLTEAKTALHLQLSSGHNVFLHAKDRKFLEDMRDALWKSIASEKDVYTLTLNNYGTINVAQNIQNQNGKKK